MTMTERSPGWYPDPDSPASIRWWNGTEWTNEPAPTRTLPRDAVASPSAPAAAGRPWWKSKWAIIVGVVGVVVLIFAVVAGVNLSGIGDRKPAVVAPSVAPTQESASSPDEFSASAPSQGDAEATSPAGESAAEPGATGPSTIPLGQKLTSKNFAITIHSAKVVDQIKTTTGAPLTAEAGTKLVYFHATYTVLGPNGVDLTCARYDTFIEGYDDQGGQMSDLFAEPDLAGNPVCNSKLLTGQSSDWNFAYKIVDGRAPAYLQVIDTNFYGDDQWGDPVSMLLR